MILSKNVILWINSLGILFLLIGCNKDIEKPKTLNFTVIDSLLLEEKDYMLTPLSSPVDFMNNYNTTLGIIEYTVPSKIVSYQNNGSLEMALDKSKLKNDYIFPNAAIGSFYKHQDSYYILYPTAKIIIRTDKKGVILKQIALKLPENMEFSRVPNLLYDEKSENFIIGVSLSSYTSNNEYYLKSPVVGIFNIQGDLLKVIGQYPKEYQDKGKFFQSSFSNFHIVKDNNYFYILFAHKPFIEKYKFDGTLVEKIDITSKNMDYEIRFHNATLEELNDEAKIKQNEYYSSMAIDATSQKLYVVANKKKSRVVGCYNQKTKTYQETDISIRGIIVKLLPQVKNDTLYFYPINLNSDDKILIRSFYN